MNEVRKETSLAIINDGKNGSSARTAVAGLAMLMTFWVGSVRNSTARRPQEARSADLKLSVLVYNYAGISADMLGFAEGEAERIFAKEGVHLEWHSCSATTRGESDDSTCAEPLAPSELRLRIVTRVKLMGIYASGEVAGFTIGDLATVQLEPLLELQLRTPTESFLSLMLGRAIAHEFGHALLGPGHSSQGIMQALWGGEQLGLAAANAMVFTPDQEKALRLAIMARLAGKPDAFQTDGQELAARHER